LIIACGDGAVDLEVTDHAFNPVALAVELFVVAELDLSVRLWRDDGLDTTVAQVAANGISVIGLVGEERLRGMLR
jgi:hypothetical protein